MNFNFSEEVKSLGVNGVYFAINGMKNKKNDAEFDKIRDSFLQQVDFDSINDKIENSNVLRGFRELHEAVNCSGKKYVSASENLFRYFASHKNLPNINLIVDIYNYISFRSELAIGAHDIQFINGDIDFRLTKGTELFWPLGYPKAISIKAGEYCYIDASNDVICRMEVRQVEKTKVTENTTSCFYIVQGNKATPSSHIIETAKELIDITTKFCGGEAEYLYHPQNANCVQRRHGRRRFAHTPIALMRESSLFLISL